jgi:hypothetical protein
MIQDTLRVIADLEKLRDAIPQYETVIKEAVSTLYRQAAIIAEVKSAIKDR